MIQVEQLLAVTGIFPKAPHPSQHDSLAATGIVDQMAAGLKRWLSAAAAKNYEPRPYSATEPPEAEKLQAKILPGAGVVTMDPEEEARLLGAFDDPELSSEYLAAVKQARAYLDARWPKIQIPGAIDEVFPPSEAELNDLWALVRVLDDPATTIVGELETQTLSIPMIEAWRTIYPELSAQVLDKLDGFIIERKAEKKPITWQQGDLIRMLHGVPLDAPIVIAKEQPKPQPQQAAAAT